MVLNLRAGTRLPSRCSCQKKTRELEAVQVAAEALIGGIIILLAVRLLLRWRRGVFHAHAHVLAGSLGEESLA